MSINLSGSLLLTGSLTTSGALTGYNYTFADGQYIRNSNQSNANGTLYLDSSNLYIRRADNATNLMFVSSSGNVGIGTTSPVAKLQIYGTETSPSLTSNTGIFTVNSTSTVQLNVGGNNSSPYPIWLQTRDTSGGSNVYPLLLNPLGGNVGIGTTAPASLLDVRGATPFIRITDTSGTTETGLIMDYTGGFIRGGLTINYGTAEFKHFCGVSGNSYFQTFHTNGSERMRITSEGDVAIGNTGTSGHRLAVKGGGNTSGTYALVVTNSSSTDLFALRNDGAFYTGTASSSPYNNVSGGTANLIVTSAGSLERATSSLKYKKNVSDYTKGLNEVMQLRPVSYQSKNTREEGVTFAGLIAEEVHDLGLTEFVQYAEDNTPDALSYANMTSLLIKAIQEQQATIQDLTTRLTALENK